ncbi:PpiB Peptidyl-prolyl cis-trans isomerase (rotamase) - cyclophilin family [Candidatus Nanopelagicaceae bacterium]
MKRIATICAVAFALTTFFVVQPAQAAVKCSKVTSVGHTPLKTNPPRTAAKVLPKTITFITNCGNIVATLDPKAPFTVTQMAALAKAKYFDKSLCHRLITDGFSMLQCGDPTATGSGGPGFSYIDENLPIGAKLTYPAGTLAMANSGPNTNGSQFFLVFEDSGSLGPSYTVWGHITSGLDILRYVGKAGATVNQTTGNSAPNQKVEIQRVLIK